MARYHIIIGWASALFISSCAQIGVLSGGEKDRYAPSPIHAKGDTPSESVSFTDQHITITFDEYFKLSNPIENIVIVPPHAKLKTKVNKKTLTVYWEDTLAPNTTYSVYFNNAVSDITEGNDSIMHFVFSTGSELDSLSYTTFVSDARTSGAQSGITVALYDSTGSDLISIGKTDISGKITLSNLKKGVYRLDAFEDKNKNLRIDDSEKVGFHEDPFLKLDSSIVDSIPIRLFAPMRKPGISSARFIEPSSFAVAATRSLEQAQIIINGELIAAERIRLIDSDSILVFPTDSILSSSEIIVQTSDFSDTSYVKLKRNRTPVIRIKPQAGIQLAPSDSLQLTLNDIIIETDPTKIKLVRKSDSTSLIFSMFKNRNTLHLFFDRTEESELKLILSDSAIQCENGYSSAHQINLTVLPDRKFGSVNLELGSYTTPVIVTPVFNGKPLYNKPVSNPSEVLHLKELLPGEYSFIIIRDLNGNGIWDTGDPDLRTQPEPIDHYTQQIKVRANWEVSVPLKPSSFDE